MGEQSVAARDSKTQIRTGGVIGKYNNATDLLMYNYFTINATRYGAQGKEMEFKTGQVWRTRDGKIVTIESIEPSSEAIFIVQGSDKGWRTAEGFYFGAWMEDGRDLVAPITDVQDEEQQSSVESGAERDGAPIKIASSEQRNEHIAKIILAGIGDGMKAMDISEFIGLYDEAVGWTN
ncbi:hypothetical protein [Microvirga sp. 17 mud 1-3]|uniref:hypothetical protein n=1 Tax=Microvirga sp. 17 mud 1-3 TaxID=2082949 RepID=UPI000D6D9B95|nr:hypothetical protein [Microvirga sp. 17 mud 1-3]AWM87345.1 hypothetical protein C4E04_11775 [Microvirga sp. 17 mud 1-3]